MKLQVAHSEYKKLSDEELVHRYVHKQEQVAITHLFDRYGHLVYGVCQQYLKDTERSKDATQQIFIKLLEDLGKYEIQHFKAWLYQVAKNHCLMQLRKPVTVINNEFITNEPMEFEEDWHHKIEQEQLLDQLEVALAQLNYEQRTCVELFYLQNLTYQQIAAKTNYSLLQVKSHIQNGRRNLKIKIEALRNVRL